MYTTSMSSGSISVSSRSTTTSSNISSSSSSPSSSTSSSSSRSTRSRSPLTDDVSSSESETDDRQKFTFRSRGIPSDRKKYFRRRLPIRHIPEREMARQCRFGRKKLKYITSLVSRDLRPKYNGKRVIPLESRVLGCMRLLASGAFQDDVAERVGCSKQSLSSFFNKFLDGMLRHMNEVIKFPLDDRRWLERTSRGFNHIGGDKGLKGVIGIVDGTHVRIVKPAVEGDCYYFKGGKEASINIQVVCGAKGEILDICANNPGSSHDTFVFATSYLKDRLEDAVERGNFPFFLIGDQGYPTSRILVSPVRRPANEQQRQFNKVLSRTRILIEQTIGSWKGRFLVVDRKGGTLCYTPDKVAKMVVVAAMLHNIKISDEFGSDDSELEDSDGDGNNGPIPGGPMSSFPFRDRLIARISH